jgi:hypothetical protein
MSMIAIVLLIYYHHKPINVHMPISSSSLVITTDMKTKYTFSLLFFYVLLLKKYHMFFKDLFQHKLLSSYANPLSLVSTIEELLERKSSSSGLETDITAIGDPQCWLCDTSLSEKLALTSPTSGSHSVNIVSSRAQATEFRLVMLIVPIVSLPP